MPMKYKMQSIESLASIIKEKDLDIGHFGEKVEKYKTSYCQYLKETTGEVTDCKELNDCEYLILGDAILINRNDTFFNVYPSCIVNCYRYNA